MNVQFYGCNICGNIIIHFKKTAANVVCCGEEMKILEPKTADDGKEKHVPTCSLNGNVLVVTVGSTLHPMTNEHYIEWILVETNKGFHKIDFKPNATPEAKITLADGEKVVAIYSYCNIHGLWKNVSC